MTDAAREIPTPPRRALRLLVLTLPTLFLLASLAAVTWHASIVIDQTRYFYLDDVQMISMRYARHVADGQGLVWNPGERVEGYSNPGWVLAMAAIHLAGVPPATSALWVKVVAGAAAVGILSASLRLARTIGPLSLAGEFVLLVGLAMSADVVFWAANGFETTLLTTLFIWLLARVASESLLDGALRPSTMIAAGCLPIIRSDAHLLAVATAIVGVGLSSNPTISLRNALLIPLIPIAHLTVRLAYYGDLLPNTFYLRYADVTGVWLEGARYVRNLLINYGPLIAIAGVSAFTATNRTRIWLLVPIICAGAHALLAGGDMYAHFRFFAPAVPVLLILAIAGVEEWTKGSVWQRAGGLVTVAVLAILAGDMLRSSPIDALRSWRGKPWQGAILGSIIEQHSSKTATVAAVDIGAIGYFSRRRVIDLTGRTDRVIARGPGRPGADPAWRKFDIERSLAARPDFIATSAAHEAARLGEGMFALQGVETSTQVVPALVSSRTFLRLYRDSPVPFPLLLERTALYIRADSLERLRVERWRMPDANF